MRELLLLAKTEEERKGYRETGVEKEDLDPQTQLLAAPETSEVERRENVWARGRTGEGRGGGKSNCRSLIL